MKYKIFLEKWDAGGGIDRTVLHAVDETDLQAKVGTITSDRPQDLIEFTVTLES